MGVTHPLACGLGHRQKRYLFTGTSWPAVGFPVGESGAAHLLSWLPPVADSLRGSSCWGGGDAAMSGKSPVQCRHVAGVLLLGVGGGEGAQSPSVLGAGGVLLCPKQEPHSSALLTPRGNGCRCKLRCAEDRLRQRESGPAAAVHISF